MGTALGGVQLPRPTNPVRELIENLILDLDLEIINHTDCPPTFVSDMGHSTWIDLTLGYSLGALSVLDWMVDMGFLQAPTTGPYFSALPPDLYIRKCSAVRHGSGRLGCLLCDSLTSLSPRGYSSLPREQV